MHERIGPTIGNLNSATHEVRFEGPAEVSDAAERVRQTARRVQPRLKALTVTGRRPPAVKGTGRLIRIMENST
ncbi:hypothetical protein ACFVJM_24750 [Streptomyces virginiae]|uniref:hypothetical protein n=1 Tax=Streptomyces virginiae TaxID=1961 RepID=UPI003626BC62